MGAVGRGGAMRAMRNNPAIQAMRNNPVRGESQRVVVGGGGEGEEQGAGEVSRGGTRDTLLGACGLLRRSGGEENMRATGGSRRALDREDQAGWGIAGRVGLGAVGGGTGGETGRLMVGVRVNGVGGAGTLRSGGGGEVAREGETGRRGGAMRRLVQGGVAATWAM